MADIVLPNLEESLFESVVPEYNNGNSSTLEVMDQQVRFGHVTRRHDDVR